MGWVVAADDDDGAGCVLDAVLAHRAEQHAGDHDADAQRAVAEEGEVGREGDADESVDEATDAACADEDARVAVRVRRQEPHSA